MHEQQRDEADGELPAPDDRVGGDRHQHRGRGGEHLELRQQQQQHLELRAELEDRQADQRTAARASACRSRGCCGRRRRRRRWLPGGRAAGARCDDSCSSVWQRRISPLVAGSCPRGACNPAPAARRFPRRGGQRRRERGHRSERPAALRPEASATGGGLFERLPPRPFSQAPSGALFSCPDAKFPGKCGIARAASCAAGGGARRFTQTRRALRRRERGHRGERPAALRPEASATGGGLLERLGPPRLFVLTPVAAFSSSLSQISLRVGNAGTAWRRRATRDLADDRDRRRVQEVRHLGAREGRADERRRAAGRSRSGSCPPRCGRRTSRRRCRRSSTSTISTSRPASSAVSEVCPTAATCGSQKITRGAERAVGAVLRPRCRGRARGRRRCAPGTCPCG